MSDIGFRDSMKNSLRWLLRWRHPFWWLPDVPTEQDASYLRIWSQLRQLDHVEDGRHDTRNFFERSGDLVIVCARVTPETLPPAFNDLVESLSDIDFVRLVSPNTYNVTVQELGYLSERPNGRDEITQLWLDEYLEQCHISLRDFRPFNVTLGGVNSYADAAFLDVHDDGWFSRIHDVLVDFVSQPPKTRFPYLPEFVIAQYMRKSPIGNLVSTLTPFRDTTFGSFRVENVDVVRISTTEPFAEPELIRSYQLGKLTGFMDRVTSANTP